jgi:hypothetical protein
MPLNQPKSTTTVPSGMSNRTCIQAPTAAKIKPVKRTASLNRVMFLATYRPTGLSDWRRKSAERMISMEAITDGTR